LRLCVSAPATRATFRVSRNFEIRIRAMDGDLPVAWEPDWDRSLVPLDGGRLVSEQEDGGVVRVMVDRPGTYRVALPSIEGYRPVPPQEVVVGDELLSEVRIDLVRR
jgi:hypothetical protein